MCFHSMQVFEWRTTLATMEASQDLSEHTVSGGIPGWWLLCVGVGVVVVTTHVWGRRAHQKCVGACVYVCVFNAADVAQKMSIA